MTASVRSGEGSIQKITSYRSVKVLRISTIRVINSGTFPSSLYTGTTTEILNVFIIALSCYLAQWKLIGSSISDNFQYGVPMVLDRLGRASDRPKWQAGLALEDPIERHRHQGPKLQQTHSRH